MAAEKWSKCPPSVPQVSPKCPNLQALKKYRGTVHLPKRHFKTLQNCQVSHLKRCYINNKNHLGHFGHFKSITQYILKNSLKNTLKHVIKKGINRPSVQVSKCPKTWGLLHA